jgi:hypothetical protein
MSRVIDGAEVEESLIIVGGWPDGGSFHMIEFTQTLLERRKGGETGVAWVEAMKVHARVLPPLPLPCPTVIKQNLMVVLLK